MHTSRFIPNMCCCIQLWRWCRTLKAAMHGQQSWAVADDPWASTGPKISKLVRQTQPPVFEGGRPRNLEPVSRCFQMWSVGRFNTVSTQRGSFYIYWNLSLSLTISLWSLTSARGFFFIPPAAHWMFVDRKTVSRDTHHEHLSRWALWKHLQSVYSLFTTQWGNKCLNLNSPNDMSARVRGFHHWPQLNNGRGGQQGAAWINAQRDQMRRSWHEQCSWNHICQTITAV